MRRLRMLRSGDASGQQGCLLWTPPQLTEERRERLKGHVQGRSNYKWHFPSKKRSLSPPSATTARAGVAEWAVSLRYRFWCGKQAHDYITVCPASLKAGLCLSGETAERGLRYIHRSGQPRKTPGFKQEILFQQHAITTPHSLHCADLSTEHCERPRSRLFSWPRHNMLKLIAHSKCGCDNMRILWEEMEEHCFI